MAFLCEYCSKNFTRKESLTRHKRNCETNPGKTDLIFECNKCDASFKRKDALRRHGQTCGNKLRNLETQGVDCDIRVDKSHYAAHLRSRQHKINCQQKQQSGNKRRIKEADRVECVECDIRVDKRHYAAHRRSRQHKINCQQKQQSGNKRRIKEADRVECVECDIRVDKRHYAAHRRSRQHKINCQQGQKIVGFKRRRLETHGVESVDSDIRVDVRHYTACLRSNKHKIISQQERDGVFKLKTCFESRVCSYKICDDEKHFLPDLFMKAIAPKVLSLMKTNLEQLKLYKINFELFADFTNVKSGEKDGFEGIRDTKSFNTTNIIVLISSDIEDIFSQVIETVKTKSEEFAERNSGWTILSIRHLEANFHKYSPISGSTYIKLPLFIALKKACVNVENEDNACFAWAVVSALYPPKFNSNRTSSYPNPFEIDDADLNFKDISFPMKVSQISTFEKNNKDISINVFGFEDGQIVGPYYFTPCKKSKHVNLLLIEDGVNSHYCWIKSLSRLVTRQITQHKCRLWICDVCLLYFRTSESYKRHISIECNKIVTTLPSPENNILKFEKHQNLRKMIVPFVIYADFECILKPIQNCQPNNDNSFTISTHEHIPHSFGYFIKCAYDDDLNKFVHYRGKDCMEVFNKYLKREAIAIDRIYSLVKPMKPLTFEQLNDFNSALICFICKGELGLNKVRDHCHLTGVFRGAAHKECNLNFKIPKFIPVILHNLSGYDSHFIVKTFGLEGNEQIDVIAQNKEKYISFTKHVRYYNKNEIKTIQLRYIDSFRFMPSSLNKLSSNLTPEQFECMRKYFPGDQKLMCKKGVFPYEYVTSFERLNETKLPPKSVFQSTVSNSGISDAEYAHANSIWKRFDCKTLGGYSDLYLKTDVLLLADVFENFRKVCRLKYELDPAHYYTTPGLSWDAMLKYTNIELELLTDYEMYKFVQKGIRGGLSQCSGRHSLANNKHMDGFDARKQSKFIVYLDANNQYGWAMSQHMPYKDFRWLNEEEIGQVDIANISLTSDKGYFLEVDLDYPSALHHEHNDLPFCPDSVVPPNAKTPKLIANLESKKCYIIHYGSLKQCLANGLKLTKIHRVVEFSQKPWLKQYIDLNTRLRTEANNAFEKDFYKLMNNAVFGKTMENVDKRVDVKLATVWRNKQLGATNLINKPNFHSSSIIHENLLVVQLNRCHVTYNKPIYIGFAVLDISKTLMYDFHYRYIRPKYESNAKMLYTDTDSFIYEIKTDDFYDDIKNDLVRYFDTSDLPPDNVYSLPLVNKKKPGMMKDELNGEIILEFCGLRSKCYAIRKQGGEEIKKIKGIKRNVVANKITSNDFVSCQKEKRVMYRTQAVFKSLQHQVFTQIMNKVALSDNDNKRFIIPNDDSGATLAWGNKDIDLGPYS